MTTLRLYNAQRESGGEWFAAAVTEYHRSLLRECCAEEPARGLYAAWHDIVE